MKYNCIPLIPLIELFSVLFVSESAILELFVNTDVIGSTIAAIRSSDWTVVKCKIIIYIGDSACRPE